MKLPNSTKTGRYWNDLTINQNYSPKQCKSESAVKMHFGMNNRNLFSPITQSSLLKARLGFSLNFKNQNFNSTYWIRSVD